MTLYIYNVKILNGGEVMVRVSNLKLNLQKSLKYFFTSVCFMCVVSFITIHFDTDRWVLGFLPSIVGFSFVGAFAVARALVYMSSIANELEPSDESAINEKFIGINGVQGFLYAIIPLVWIIIAVASYFTPYSILELNIKNSLYSCGLLIAIFIAFYFVIDNLSFVMFFISIVYGWTKTSKVKKIKDDIIDKSISEDYDVDGNVKKLIIKNTERVEWLENHLNEENDLEYKAKIAAYQAMISDLRDFIYGIDV